MYFIALLTLHNTHPNDMLRFFKLYVQFLIALARLLCYYMQRASLNFRLFIDYLHSGTFQISAFGGSKIELVPHKLKLV